MKALECAQAVREGRLRAVTVTERVLDRITAGESRINAVTRLLSAQALERASTLDARLARGEKLGVLAGVAFGIKDLFDVEGCVTTAGSTVLSGMAPASRDAVLVRRLIEADAIPVAMTNMDEFAYGFATDNAHYGVTRNPHDPERLAGGSSGGSAAGVAAGYFPVSLGSDTNGSIRVPASLCGIWGLRGTQGLFPTEGSYPFAASLDTVGPFTASAFDLRVVVEVLSGKALKPVDCGALRLARLGGWFADNLTDPMAQAVGLLCNALSVDREVIIPGVAVARAAAFIISASEGGSLHLDRLRTQAAAYDPAVRDRLLAGALVPAPTVFRAQQVRRWFRTAMHEAFADTDIMIAPAVVGAAPRFDEPTIVVGGQAVSARANLGLYTQPLTLAGFPVLTVPLAVSGMPLGAQLIARPGREDQLIAMAEALELAGLARPRIREV